MSHRQDARDEADAEPALMDAYAEGRKDERAFIVGALRGELAFAQTRADRYPHVLSHAYFAAAFQMFLADLTQ